MSAPSALPRKLALFAILLPLAAFVGYLLSSPDAEAILLIGALVGLLILPLFLTHHHAILIGSLNLSMTLFFLPGNPPIWIATAGISLGLTLLARIMDKHKKLLGDTPMTLSLLLLVGVVLLTMASTTGLGIRSLGGAYYGGRKYVFILAAVIAYFALSTVQTPIPKLRTRLGTYFLSGVTPVMSHVIYLMGPSMWVLYRLFSVDWAIGQAVEDLGGTMLFSKIGRLAGLAPAGTAVFSFVLARYGVRGVLDLSHPGRMFSLFLAVSMSLLGGFRSVSVYFALVLFIQFFLEGLHKTRLMPTAVLSLSIVLASLVPIAHRLPLPVQRCFTVLPYNLSPIARADAKASTEWRLKMWEVLVQEVPKYLWKGKGCGASATDYYLAFESVRRGFTQDIEFYMLAGDYHSGPLSVIIPFGVLGAAAFLAVVLSCFRILIRNYRYGDSQLISLNTFFLAAFMAKILFFIFLFGAIHSDLVTLVGMVGLSISINGGVKVPVPGAGQKTVREESLPNLTPARA